MPEGHTIHRYARQHRRLLRGHVLHASSPQGRFAQGAAQLDGQALETVDP
jgi:endonuclease VIII